MHPHFTRDEHRGVAQLASALAWGARGRKFESFHPDEKERGDDVASLFLGYGYQVTGGSRDAPRASVEFWILDLIHIPPYGCHNVSALQIVDARDASLQITY